MTHVALHFNLALGGYQSCLCDCYDCMSMKTECLCKDCSCKDPKFAPRHHNPMPEAVEEPPVMHPCVVCFKEVTRRGSRGRWPSRCVEHR